MTELTIKEKIANIRKCADYRQIAWDWFPPAHADEYYFISYSHKDYKEVFEDIYALQQQGLHVWYDKELRPGEDWEIEARTHIYDFKCKGVIFYISKNSVASESIHREIGFVKKSGKKFLSINLPADGEYLSASEILRRVQPEIDQSSPKFKTLEATFNDNVTYLKLSEEPRARAERIKNALVRLPLLRFAITRNRLNRPFAIVTGINDINATVIREEDFICEESGANLSASEIATCAFANCAYLEEVSLPETLSVVGDNAFRNCTSLRVIELPKNLTSINMWAFSGCTALKNIEIPDNVQTVGCWAFSGCTSLESVKIGKGVKNIYECAFEKCSSLKAVYIEDLAAWCGIRFSNLADNNGVEYGNPLLHAHNLYLNGKKTTTLEIPEGVTEISDGAFICLQSITKVIIPDSVIKISDNAFEGCDKLVEVVNLSNLNITAGDNGNGGIARRALNVTGSKETSKIKKYGDFTVYEDGSTVYLLEYTGKRAKLRLPDKIGGKSYGIYHYAFSGNKNIKSIKIPDSVNIIGEYAFSGCDCEIEWGGNPAITKIGDYAFFGYCGKSITIPDSVNIIGKFAFCECANLADITLGKGITAIGDGAFRGCAALASLKIPDSVTSIGGWAFSDCVALASFEIPDSVISIGGWAFVGCKSLKRVTFKNKTGWKMHNLGKDVDMNVEDAEQNAYNIGKAYIDVDWRREPYV